ncbi:2-amino-4-hydroxy-6-hydroxymethyldihydropteridinediphosphokinase [Phycisphaerales bacterium]|nr:2-amino-4-hydroxy-6-hydroxymethyldihydropteridinediphosphokinase [Phycisphaerales bacterium]
MPNPAAIALGSNLGDRRAHLEAALAALSREPAIRNRRVSEFIQTAPVSDIPQGPYFNAAAVFETTLPARALLGVLLEIETARGRDRAREQRWGPRTLDLDLLLYADLVIDEPDLRVPHPRMHERLFVLEPLSQVAPDWIVATQGRTVRQLRDALRGEGSD